MPWNVEVTFTLFGTVADFGLIEQNAIKRTLATAANVSTSAVSLTIVASNSTLATESVKVTAVIIVATKADAVSVADKLNTGILKDGDTLEAALKAEGLTSEGNTKLVDASDQPTAKPNGPSNNNDLALGLGIGLGLGIPLLCCAIGALVAGLVIPKCCTGDGAKAPQSTTTTVEITSASSSSVEDDKTEKA